MSEYSHKMEMVDISCSPDPGLSPAIEKIVMEIYGDFYHELIDHIILGICFEIIDQCKDGIFLFLNNDEMYFPVKEPRVQHLFPGGFIQDPIQSKLIAECTCPNCNRNIASCRFAPHLEKCLGLGRLCSRAFQRRTRNISKATSEEPVFDYGEKEWFTDTPKVQTKQKKEKNSKKAKIDKWKLKFERLSLDTSLDEDKKVEMKLVLEDHCGVISDRTSNMCFRTKKCPQHTDYQRAAIRQKVNKTKYHDLVVDIEGELNTESLLSDSFHDVGELDDLEHPMIVEGKASSESGSSSSCSSNDLETSSDDDDDEDDEEEDDDDDDKMDVDEDEDEEEDEEDEDDKEDNFDESSYSNSEDIFMKS